VPRTSPALVALIGAAVAAGAGAGLLAGATPTPLPVNPAPPPAQIPPWLLGLLLISPLVLGFVGLLLRRLTGGAMAVPRRTVVTAIVFVALVLAFMVMAHFYSSNSPWPLSTQGGGTNSTQSGGTNSTGSNGTSGNSTGTGNASAFELHPPTWLPLVVVAGVGVIAAAVLIPAVASWAAKRRRGPTLGSVAPLPQAEVQSALADAAAALDQGNDPRTVIVRLYERLLERLAPLVGDVDNRTAREIRDLHLLPLRVGRPSAEALTQLFEEARYSSRPMEQEAATRASEAIRAAEADIARSRPSA
jgi:uncharacterized protein DUF4129